MAHDTTVKNPPGARLASAAVRRTAFLFIFLFIYGGGILLFADFLWRTGLYGLKYSLLALHALLFALITYVFCTVLFGFLSVRLGWLAPNAETAPSAPLPPTAIVFPIHDEEVAGVLARVEAVWRSLQRTGQEAAFHLFVLSDSLNPERWIEEEIAWFHVVRRLNAVGQVHYRHRPCNDGFKVGNLTDFLENWGQHYRYMIVFDADSLMSGERMAGLVRRMEAHPRTGIMQTVTGAVCARSLYARTQQFASRLYSRLFMAGMNFWQEADGNYFGHNAIIRVQPFMDNCRLPHLPWREPLGGQIYSHDFVEAALMRRAGWEVRIAHDPDGSYEEAPVDMLENVRRHRRWCQGNLQHAWLLFSRDLPPASRCNFLLGILAYISSLLWLLFLFFSTLVVIQFKRSGLSFITTSGFASFIDLSLPVHGSLLFGLSLFLLFAPKLLCLVDLLCEPARRRLFGGSRRAATGVLLESLCGILAAPMFMLWHSLFVLTILFGKGGSGWGGQKRSSRDGLSWRDAARSHGWMTLIGLGWELLALSASPSFGFWMLPVLAPMIFSIPLNVLFSSVAVGDRQRGAGRLQTPEETDPPQELRDFAEAELQIRARLQRVGGNAAMQAIIDPYVNALHGELQLQPHMAEFCGRNSNGHLASLLLSKGLSALTRDQLFALLLDGSACRRIHLQLWHTPDAGLAPEWQAAIAAYAPDSKPPLLNGT